MDPPPTYSDLMNTLILSNKQNLSLEFQVKELKQHIEILKVELDKVNNAYTKAKKNEVLLTSVLQSKI
jgi:hypothetical protein